MKILYITHGYAPNVGGVEYVVKSIAERLAKKGHDVIVLAGSRSNNVEEQVINGVRVIRWPVFSPGEAYHIPKRVNKFTELVKRIAKNADVIHFQNVHSVFPVYALRVLKDISAKKVFTLHYHGTGHTLFRRTLWLAWRSFVKKTIKECDIIHAVSKYEAKIIEKHFKFKPIVIIENGVEEWITNFNWTPQNYAMYSGKIAKYKNVHRFARIISILNKEYNYELELKIYGDGPYRAALEKHLRKLQIKYHLKYHLNPYQPYDKYIETLSKAMLFGQLSEREAFSIVTNEANAIGVPVVVAEPWGLNFAERPRTLIVSLSLSDYHIAKKVASFLENIKSQPKPNVKTWNEIIDKYMHELYA
ncbi:glycosyltransferase family 4 protein [Pyrobaculum sp.]|uniref:glycosyltransferase family 4 protein n=1 Tax=Pyrobaculum sp. TaxID=2004705 RepID=UPI0031600758